MNNLDAYFAIPIELQMNELQNSTKFIMDSVVQVWNCLSYYCHLLIPILITSLQTLETVSAQQEQLNRALILMQNGAWGNGQAGSSGGGISSRDVERLHADLGIVKSLLLNGSQFPPPVPLNQQQAKTTALPNGETEGTRTKDSMRLYYSTSRLEERDPIPPH